MSEREGERSERENEVTVMFQQETIIICTSSTTSSLLIPTYIMSQYCYSIIVIPSRNSGK